MAKAKKTKTERMQEIQAKLNAEKGNVPLDGKAAYAAGFTAADCPYAEGQEDFERWNADFDAAADEQTAKDQELHTKEETTVANAASDEAAESEGEEADAEPAEEEVAEKSVVKSEYRARYAEAGHPAHCGDELAVLLNNLCLTKKGIEIDRFETICEANGVSLAKYNRTTKGWQGRLRMTGRNLLATKVYEANGVLKTGNLEGVEQQEYRVSAEWMANRRKIVNG